MRINAASARGGARATAHTSSACAQSAPAERPRPWRVRRERERVLARPAREARGHRKADAQRAQQEHRQIVGVARPRSAAAPRRARAPCARGRFPACDEGRRRRRPPPRRARRASPWTVDHVSVARHALRAVRPPRRRRAPAAAGRDRSAARDAPRARRPARVRRCCDASAREAEADERAPAACLRRALGERARERAVVVARARAR